MYEKTAVRVEVKCGDAVLRGEVAVEPQRKWTVFVVQHSHLDVGYTDRQSVVLRNHEDYLDSALRLIESTNEWPEDAKFRWTVESALPFLRWFESRTADERRVISDACRNGLIEVTAFPFQLHTEACSTDELYRLIDIPRKLASAHGIPIVSAMHTDVPGATAGVVDALTAAGVRYLAAAHNWAGRSIPYLVGGQVLERPFWWRAASGQRVLVWFTDTPHGMAYMEGNIVGLGEGSSQTEQYLPDYLRALTEGPFPYGAEMFGWSGIPADIPVVRPPYRHDLLHLRVQGADTDNAGPSPTPANVVRAWNEKYAYPHLRSAINRDFFTVAEGRLGTDLPEFEGDWTDWWADGLGSGARPLGRNRQAQARLRAAEVADVLADVQAEAPEESDEPTADDEPGAAMSPVASTEGVLLKIGLFNEHTWGAHLPWDDDEDGDGSGALQWARKSEFAYQAFDDTTDLLHSALHRLGQRTGTVAEALATVVVLNSVARVRTDVVDAFVPSSAVPLDTPLSVVDRRTGSRLVHREKPVLPEDWPFRPIGRHVQCIVTDVPAVGWVCLDLVAGDGPIADVDLGRRTTLENSSYRVEYDLDAASITSIKDVAAPRELVNGKAVSGFNQYVHDLYGTASGFAQLSGQIDGDLSLLGRRATAEHGVVRHTRRTAIGEVLTISATGEGIRSLHTQVRLPACGSRVEIRNRIVKQPAAGKESLFFAFPFSNAGPPCAWELTGAVGGAHVAQVPGSTEHMRAIRHWVAFEEGNSATAWATLEAPLIQLGNIALPYAPFPATLRLEQPEPATIYSWVMNNIWDTNFPHQQQGEMTFHYAVSSASEGSARALGAHTAAALTDPLLGVIAGSGIRPTAAASRSLLTLENEEVSLISLRPGGSGRGFVAWLRSLAARDQVVEVRIPEGWAERATAGTVFEAGAVVPISKGGAIEVNLPAGSVVKLAVD